MKTNCEKCSVSNYNSFFVIFLRDRLLQRVMKREKIITI